MNNITVIVRSADKVFKPHPNGRGMFNPETKENAVSTPRYQYGLEDQTEMMLAMAGKVDGNDYSVIIPLAGKEILETMTEKGLERVYKDTVFTFRYDQEHVGDDKKTLEPIFPYGFDTPKEESEDAI